jgi:hypothetical protein
MMVPIQGSSDSDIPAGHGSSTKRMQNNEYYKNNKQLLKFKRLLNQQTKKIYVLNEIMNNEHIPGETPYQASLRFGKIKRLTNTLEKNETSIEALYGELISKDNYSSISNIGKLNKIINSKKPKPIVESVNRNGNGSIRTNMDKPEPVGEKSKVYSMTKAYHREYYHKHKAYLQIRRQLRNQSKGVRKNVTGEMLYQDVYCDSFKYNSFVQDNCPNQVQSVGQNHASKECEQNNYQYSTIHADNHDQILSISKFQENNFILCNSL